LREAGVPIDRRAAELRREERAALVEHLTTYVLPWTGDEGYKKAEVTGGGVALDEVDPRTLESRRCPGLFLCGELLDAFGPIGGHNFAWAWATGRLAGRGAAAAQWSASHR
jgi:predicted flavoprotein YhiN